MPFSQNTIERFVKWKYIIMKQRVCSQDYELMMLAQKEEYFLELIMSLSQDEGFLKVTR